MTQLRRKVKKRLRPKQRRFEDWLRERGLDYKANRLRYRNTLEALPLEFRGVPTVMATPKREPFASYAAHRQALLKVMPEAEPDLLIASIALQIRKEGFSQAAVEDAVYHHAPEDRPDQPEQNRRRYAERIATHTFGIAGDVQFAQGLAEQQRQRQEREKLGEVAQREEEQQAQERQEGAVRQIAAFGD